MMPNVQIEIIDSTSIGVIDQRISKSECKHILVAMRAQYEAERLHAMLAGRGKPIYNYFTRSIKKYNEYATTGGILLSTNKFITEGVNINHCDLFIIQCSDESAMSLRRMQQLVGRVIRQSAIYTDISIIFYVSTPVMTARAILSPVQCSGYEVRTTNLAHRLGKIIDKWKTMTPGELLLVLAESVTGDPYFEGALTATTMSELELHKLILT